MRNNDRSKRTNCVKTWILTHDWRKSFNDKININKRCEPTTSFYELRSRCAKAIPHRLSAQGDCQMKQATLKTPSVVLIGIRISPSRSKLSFIREAPSICPFVHKDICPLFPGFSQWRGFLISGFYCTYNSQKTKHRLNTKSFFSA